MPRDLSNLLASGASGQGLLGLGWTRCDVGSDGYVEEALRMVGRPSILIIDGQTSITSVLERCLGSKADRLQTVNNSADAVQALKNADFDLVLVDPSLPPLPGLDLVQALRARNEGTAVVVMTTAPSVAVTLESHGLDVAAVLEKPFTLTELRDAIAPIIGNAGS